MAEPIEIDVWQGDIGELEVDALVVPANESLFMTSGPAASVRLRGGDQVERAAVEQGPVRPGSAVATHGGRLATPYVIHAVAVGHDRVADPANLEAAVRSALAFAEPLQLRRVAMSLLGVEHGAFTPPDAAAIMIPAVLELTHGSPIESIVLAAAHHAELQALLDALARARSGASVS